jgi:hypothetical protein
MSVVQGIVTFLAANPYAIHATDIGLPTSTSTVGEGLTNIVKLLMVVVGMLAVVAMIAGGILLVISRGDPGRVKQGRETILYASIGLVVAVAAYTIVAFISGGAAGKINH